MPVSGGPVGAGVKNVAQVWGKKEEEWRSGGRFSQGTLREQVSL